MTAQETTFLPQRLARSAKDLAQASLRGVAGELKDPRMGKQAGSSSQATAHHDDGIQGSEVPRSRRALYARENSFRDQPNALASRAVEEDFERFRDDERCQKEWLSSDLTTCLSIIPDSGKYQDSLYGIQGETLASQYLTSEVASTNIANDVVDVESLRSDPAVVNDGERNSRADHARAAAARRLEQIGAQIQRNLAMQVLQQDSSSQTSFVQYESAQQATNQQQWTPQSSYTDSMSNSHQTSRHHRPTPSLERIPASVSEEARGEEDNSPLLFHCPYYACHQNLQRLMLNSTSPSQRLCVHTGCNERLENRNTWNEHIALPHHDLQG